MIIRLSLSFIILMALSPLAFAQHNASDHIFIKPGTGPISDSIRFLETARTKDNHQPEFITPHSLELSLLHYDFFEEGQFAILMKIEDTMSGCWNFSPLQYEAAFIDNNYLDIKVGHYKRTAIKTKNPEYECPAGNQAVSGLIVLNRSDLIEKNIREVRFLSLIHI